MRAGLVLRIRADFGVGREHLRLQERNGRRIGNVVGVNAASCAIEAVSRRSNLATPVRGKMNTH